MNDCKHLTVLREMCCDCGLDLSQTEWAEHSLNDSVTILHGHPDLYVSKEEANLLGRKDKEILLKARKLVLIIDLDHTVVHATDSPLPSFCGESDEVEIVKIVAQNKPMQISIRPGVRTFLKSMSELFELHVFSLGTRDYADKVVKILDPSRSLFYDRIKSRSECTFSNSKYAEIAKLFPVGSNMVCILDDCPNVWNHSLNLVPALPFYYFTLDTHDDPSGIFSKHFTFSSAARISDYCKTHTPYLDYLKKRLIKLHHYFFESYDAVLNCDPDSGSYLENRALPENLSDFYHRFLNGDNVPDVRDVLAAINMSVLSGVRIFFCDLFSSAFHVFGREVFLAETLGAKVVKSPGSKISHICCAHDIASVAGLKKRFPWCEHIVSIDWLYACYYLCSHVPETCFFLDSSESTVHHHQDVNMINPKPYKRKHGECLGTISDDLFQDMEDIKVTEPVDIEMAESVDIEMAEPVDIDYMDDPTLAEAMGELEEETEAEAEVETDKLMFAAGMSSKSASDSYIYIKDFAPGDANNQGAAEILSSCSSESNCNVDGEELEEMTKHLESLL